MLIAHNVMSLYCKYESFLNIDETMFDAIKTNYNLYLRTNVSQYLDMKRDIGKFIQNIVTQVSDYALSIPNCIIRVSVYCCINKYWEQAKLGRYFY